MYYLSLSQEEIQLLSSLAAPPTKHDIPGELATLAAMRRDPEAYKKLVKAEYLVEDSPPTLAPQKFLNLYSDWTNNLNIDHIIKRFKEYKQDAPSWYGITTITEKGWGYLMQAVEKNEIKIPLPAWVE